MSISPGLRCPCQGRFLVPAFEYKASPEGETVFDLGEQPYRRGYDCCTLCGHWFGRHDLDLSRLYAHDYAEATYGGVEGMRQRFEEIMALPPEQSDNRQRVARILSFSEQYEFDIKGASPRLLDVGAGLGVFPAAMVEAGWAVTALEPDARTVEHLQRVAGVRALSRDLLSLDPVTDGDFDVITFNKVLEHVEEPVTLLSAAVKLLGSHGIVYVEVPDVAAASEGQDREEFFLEHHHVFSPASTVMAGERAGLRMLKIERVREPSSKFTLCAFFIRTESETIYLPPIFGPRP
jgi:SAM-dependent methyltransferase